MKFLILGNGIAGLNAAIAIRRASESAEITLLSAEKRLSYNRPMLTKAAITGFNPDRFTVYSKEWYESHRITNLLGVTALELDASAKTLRTKDGLIPYDKCIYSLGAECFVPPIPGHELSGVFTIRNADDMARLRLRLLRSRRAVIIGGGVIGLEAAWELKRMKREVTVLELAPTLMERILDKQSAALLESLAAAEGVRVRTNVAIDEILGGDSDKHVLGVRFNGSETVDADLVILSCGIRPAAALAKAAGLKTNRAVVVDEKMRTSDPDIFACGDCAEYNGVNNGLWQTAALQGKVAGTNAVADTMVYEPSPAHTLMHGFNTCLFAAGDLGKNPALAYDIELRESKNNNKLGFLVNNPLKTGISYEKYFYHKGRLTGGVLIGDLTKMRELASAIKEVLV